MLWCRVKLILVSEKNLTVYKKASQAQFTKHLVHLHIKLYWYLISSNEKLKYAYLISQDSKPTSARINSSMRLYKLTKSYYSKL